MKHAHSEFPHHYVPIPMYAVLVAITSNHTSSSRPTDESWDSARADYTRVVKLLTSNAPTLLFLTKTGMKLILFNVKSQCQI